MLCRFVSDHVASYETLKTTSLHFNARAHWIFIYAGTWSPSKASQRYFAMEPNEQFEEFGQYWKYRNQEAWRAYRHVDIARQQRRLRVETQKESFSASRTKAIEHKTRYVLLRKITRNVHRCPNVFPSSLEYFPLL